MSPVYYFDIGNTRAKFWRCHDGVLVEHVAIVHDGRVADIPFLLPHGFSVAPAAIRGATVLDEADVAAAMQVGLFGPEQSIQQELQRLGQGVSKEDHQPQQGRQESRHIQCPAHEDCLRQDLTEDDDEDGTGDAGDKSIEAVLQYQRRRRDGGHVRQ